MHQDIKTFSDILAIDPADKLKIRLTIATHGDIEYLLTLNNQPVVELDTEHKLDLFSTIDLTCAVLKNNGGAVEIKLLSVNNLEILPKYQHCACPKTAWITENWQFKTLGLFYPWFHGVSGQGWVA